MPGNGEAYVAILLMGLVTVATRVLGAAIMARFSTGGWVGRFLDAMSSSVMAAIVASFLARGGVREAAVVALAAVVMFAFRNAIAALAAGAALGAAWTQLAG